MPPATVIALLQAILGITPTLIDEVQTLANKGQITADQQAAMLKAYQDLKAKVEAGPFTGPEWQV